MSAHLTHEQRLAESQIDLPAALPAFGQYVPAVRHGNQLWVGGHFGTGPDGSLLVGRCGHDVDVLAARAAARSAAIDLLATVRETLGSLDPVEQVVQVYGVVNATSEFVQHTGVIDAASDVLVEVFGDAGRHARSAVGVAELPLGFAVEVDGVFEIA